MRFGTRAAGVLPAIRICIGDYWSMHTEHATVSSQVLKYKRVKAWTSSETTHTLRSWARVRGIYRPQSRAAASAHKNRAHDQYSIVPAIRQIRLATRDLRVVRAMDGGDA